jgi:GMP synthase (glutamine-hydrolysing)
VKIPVVDNGGQWTHREYRVLRDLGAEARIVPNTTTLAELNADGIVLSGGALSLEGTDAPLGRVGDWIDRVDVPVLGICVGHQYLARHFGGVVAHAQTPEFGRVTVTLEAEGDRILGPLPPSLQVWESHNDEVVHPPPGWRKLGHSPTCHVEAMAHPVKPIWGVQFHPEVDHTEKGRELLENFLAQCRR